MISILFLCTCTCSLNQYINANHWDVYKFFRHKKDLAVHKKKCNLGNNAVFKLSEILNIRFYRYSLRIHAHIYVMTGEKLISFFSLQFLMCLYDLLQFNMSIDYGSWGNSLMGQIREVIKSVSHDIWVVVSVNEFSCLQ